MENVQPCDGLGKTYPETSNSQSASWFDKLYSNERGPIDFPHIYSLALAGGSVMPIVVLFDFAELTKIKALSSRWELGIILLLLPTNAQSTPQRVASSQAFGYEGITRPAYANVTILQIQTGHQRSSKSLNHIIGYP